MQASPPYNFHEILSNFCITGAIEEVKPFGSGHINGTFYVKNKQTDQPDFLLQLINSHVFSNVAVLSQNIQLVTSHLRYKLSLLNHHDIANRVLTLVPANDQTYYYKDENTNYWRVYLYIKKTKSYDQATTTHQAYQSGLAFGQFQSLLIDLDAGSLQETIPNFHDVDYRLQNLQNAVKKDPVHRLNECAGEIEFIEQHAGEMRYILQMQQKGQLPLRITHNDTKFNNVLLDENDCAQCVIDLDTVMPGLVAYDFGDAIRTIVNTAPEDEADLSKIDVNIDLFTAYTHGYLKQAVSFLTNNELASLLHGAFLLPYMQAVRFLTDFIEGDHYYKIQSPQHNLQRAKAQIQLLTKLQQHKCELRSIIDHIAASLPYEMQIPDQNLNEPA
ncbi:MAG: aminoglycoside phosphotransferase family protein [Bacteroidota bacterium]